MILFNPLPTKVANVQLLDPLYSTLCAPYSKTNPPTVITGALRPGSRPIASFQGDTFYCHNIISEHHRALKQIAKNCLMFA